MNTTDEPDVLAPIRALAMPDTSAMAMSAGNALEFVRAFEITDDSTYELAGEELRALVAKEKAWEAQRTGITGPINKGLDALNKLFMPRIQVIGHAVRMLKDKMVAYDTAKARAAAEQQRRQQELVDAERKRLEEEAAARTEEARVLAERAQAATGAQQADLIEQAAEVCEQALAAAQTAAIIVAPVASTEAAAPAVTGVTKKRVLEWEVIDFKALVKWVAAQCDERPEVLAYLTVDRIKLGNQCKATGAATAIDGVRVGHKAQIAVR